MRVIHVGIPTVGHRQARFERLSLSLPPLFGHGLRLAPRARWFPQERHRQRKLEERQPEERQGQGQGLAAAAAAAAAARHVGPPPTPVPPWTCRWASCKAGLAQKPTYMNNVCYHCERPKSSALNPPLSAMAQWAWDSRVKDIQEKDGKGKGGGKDASAD